MRYFSAWRDSEVQKLSEKSDEGSDATQLLPYGGRLRPAVIISGSLTKTFRYEFWTNKTLAERKKLVKESVVLQNATFIPCINDADVSFTLNQSVEFKELCYCLNNVWNCCTERSTWSSPLVNAGKATWNLSVGTIVRCSPHHSGRLSKLASEDKKNGLHATTFARFASPRSPYASCLLRCVKAIFFYMNVRPFFLA